MPDSSKSVTAQNPVFHTFCTHHHKMSFTHRIIQDRISDDIHAIHDGNYSNPTAAARALGMDPKTVHRRLHRGTSKS